MPDAVLGYNGLQPVSLRGAWAACLPALAELPSVGAPHIIRNKELLEQLLPVAADWPGEYEEPGSGLGVFISEHLSRVASLAEFKQAFWEGGYGQGDFTSYSVFSYWQAGKHQYSRGSFSYVRAAFLYVSHMAPVACFGFGEGRWQKGPLGRKHVAVPSRWSIGEPIDLTHEAPDGWSRLQKEITSGLAGTPISTISIERANSLLPGETATKYSYYEGLELPEPRLLKDLLFHEGLDWNY